MKTKRCCAQCGTALTKESQKTYCSVSCAVAAQRDKIFAEIESKGEFPSRGKFNETNRYIARRWLEHKYGHICAVCDRSEWEGQPIPLIVDHIDGNPQNNKIDNFRLICPNCDALQETYKGRNLRNDNYVKGERSERKAVEYDKRLERANLSRSEKHVRATGVCPVCGSTFSKKHSKQVYCSKPCVHEALRHREHK